MVSLLALITKAINRYIALDPESSKSLAPLTNHTIALTVTGLEVTVHIYFHEQGLTLTPPNEDVVHTTIKGSTATFLQLIKNPQRLPLDNDLEISGDVELGQQVRHFFQTLHIDWEEILSQITGDPIAYGLTHTAKKLGGWLQRGKRAFLQNTDEYIHHEIRLTPTAIELDNFHQDVIQLRDGVDRLAMGLQVLKKAQ